MSESYDIYFAGQIVDGFDDASVRKNVARLFKADEKTLTRLFSGKPQLLKRGVDKSTALKYKAALNKAGAVPLIRAATGTRPSPAVSSEHASGATASKQRAPDPAAAEPGRGSTLAERLAALTGESSPSATGAAAASTAAATTAAASTAAASTAAATTAAASTPPTPSSEGDVATDSDANLSLAPVGSDVLREEERAVVEELQIDVSAIELAEADDELPLAPPAEPPPPVPDTSHLAMGEVGEVIPHIENVVPIIDPDVSHLTMGAVGEAIPHLEVHEEPVNPDISGIELAPEGSEVLEEQYRRHVTAAAPNTDHLSLEA